MSKAKAEKTAARLEADVELFTAPQPVDYLSTGCSVFNLALSGHPERAVPKSTYLYLVGSSGSCKTWLTFMLFAEAARNPHFSKYRFVFDNAENGALRDVKRYFGSSVVNRLEEPYKGRVGSQLVQECYYHVELNVRRGPCIYVLDSMDALQDLADEENHEAELKYYVTGKGKDDIKGSMGMQKAKSNKRNIARIANSVLRQNGSILAVISQTYDMVGSRIPGQKTRSGGHALKFFAHVEAWTKVKGPIERYHAGKDREIGSFISIDVQKNRISGKHGKVPLIRFLEGHGIDETGTCVDYLIDEKHWKKPKAKEDTKARAFSDDESEEAGKIIHAPEFEFTGKPEELVQHIESNGLESQLVQLTADVWTKIASGSVPPRKARYT